MRQGIGWRGEHDQLVGVSTLLLFKAGVVVVVVVSLKVFVH